jgi:hypothetical protein
MNTVVKVEVAVTFAPLTFAPPANKIARAEAEQAAVCDVNRAVNAAFYAGLLGVEVTS